MATKTIRMNQKIFVEKATDAAPNDCNEVLPLFTPSYDRWCAAETTGGREFMKAMQVVPNLEFLLITHWDSKTSKLSPRDRIRMNGQILNIARVENKNQDNHLVLISCVQPVVT